MASEKLSQIYMSSTYAMYNLIRLLDIVIADIAMSSTQDQLKIVSQHSSMSVCYSIALEKFTVFTQEVLEEFKEAVQSSNRCAKDKLEFQGRMQVSPVSLELVLDGK